MKVLRAISMFVYLSVALLLILHPALADVGGKITGVVKDVNGGAVAGANVVVTNAATGQKQTTTTDDNGIYSFPQLAVGQYDIEASSPGFRSYRRTGLTINVSSTLQEDVTLQLQEQSKSVTSVLQYFTV